LVQQAIRESGYEEVLSSGIVITGGSAVVPGMVELGEDIFLKPCAVACRYNSALSDMVAQARAATVMGLLEEPHGGCVAGVSQAGVCTPLSVASKTGLSVTFRGEQMETHAHHLWVRPALRHSGGRPSA
jgi:cell division ATPase FtsA